MKKQQILETAHDVFYQHGFHACGVELLAREANTTKRTLYANFANKDGLITEVLNHRHQWFMGRLTQCLDEVVDKEVIAGYLLFLKDWIFSDKFYGCMFINACGEFSDPNTTPHQIAKAHKQDVRHYLQKRLHNTAIADMLFNYGEGLIVSSQAQGKFDANSMHEFIALLQSRL